MSLRFLLGFLAPGPPDQFNESQSSEFEIRSQEKDMYATIQIKDIQGPAKFHIGMLSISLIVGLATGGFIAYSTWRMEKKPFLNYVTNLLIALVCRTFFSILFDGVILLGSGTVGGGNALLAFEQICINLVLAFWLSLTIYLHARVQRNFNSEPTLNLYRYGVPGAAAFFALIWIFLLQAEFPYVLWWIILSPSTQWVVNSFNLLCTLIQLALVGDIARMMMKTSLDNDALSLFRKVAILMGVLVFIFWLQFGLFMGRLPLRNSSSYTYFFYFVDGIEGASVCLILYFFNNWVQMLLYSNSRVIGSGSLTSTDSNHEELLAGGGGRRIVTIDSVFMTNESGNLKKSEEEGSRDVVYSNVVEPQRLKNILDLYKRLNKIPNKQVMVVEGEEFYDCQAQTNRKTLKSRQGSISDESRQRVSSEDRCKFKNMKMCDQVQKRNAFYSSKYLILDSKADVPKYLETRPSLSSMSGKGSSKKDRMSKDYSPDTSLVGTEDFVQKWLSDNSKNMPKKDSITHRREEENDLSKKPLDVSKHKPTLETATNTQDTEQQTENRVSVTEKGISTIGSLLWLPFSGKDDRKNSTAKDEDSYRQEESNRHLGSDASTEPSEPVKPEAEIEEKKPAESLNQSNNSLLSKIVDLAKKPAAGSKPGEVPIGTQRELQSKPEVPLPKENEKFVEEAPVSNAQVKEQRKDDAEDSDAKGKHLDQYLTYSELQERQMSREKQATEERDQAPKSFFGFPETISSVMDYFVNGRSSLFGQRTDQELPNTENLTVDKIPRSEDKVVFEHQSAKIDMKHKTQFEEQEGKPTRVPSKAVVEGSPGKKKSISSDSEFSIEMNNEAQPPRKPAISKSEKLPKSTDSMASKIQRASMEETSSEFSIESRKNSSSSSGSFSIEQYYQQLHSAKQKIEKQPIQKEIKHK